MQQMKTYEILAQIAGEHGGCIEDVEREMEEAIDAGIHHANPNVRALWNEVPSRQEKPTPTEFIDFLVAAVYF